MKTLVARWETRGKKYWYELYKDDLGFTYRMDNGGGNLGNMSLEQAMDFIQKRIDDSAKYDGINLKRVKNPIHPQAIESLKRYKSDIKAGHTNAAEYWRGQAAAYFTSNPDIFQKVNKLLKQADEAYAKAFSARNTNESKYWGDIANQLESEYFKEIDRLTRKYRNPKRPPKKWWDMMFKKMKQEYIGTKEEISQIVGGIWANFTPKTKESIMVKYENPLIVVGSFYDIKEAKSLVSKLKLKGQKAKIHIKNRYVYPVYTVLTDVKNNPIQHGKCPAHGNKIEFAHGARKVFCNPGKHWLDIPQGNPDFGDDIETKKETLGFLGSLLYRGDFQSKAEAQNVINELITKFRNIGFHKTGKKSDIIGWGKDGLEMSKGNIKIGIRLAEFDRNTFGVGFGSNVIRDDSYYDTVIRRENHKHGIVNRIIDYYK